MPLATTTYESTDKDNILSSDLNPKGTFKANSKEQELIAQVLKRFSAMKSARSRIDTDWSTWQKIIESKYYRYPDGRTRVNVPIFRALQELFVSEATTRKIEKEIKPVGLSDIDKVEVMNEVWDYDWNKNRRDEEMTDAEYKCCAYGTTAYFTGFEQTERIISDPSVDDDGLISYKKKLMKQGRIILKTVDIRNVYFDDRTNNFDDDIDQIYIDYITPEQFRMEMNDPNLMNTDSVGTVAKTEQMYYTWEDTGKMNTGYVEKMHYWNKGADKYIILYNRGILGRNSPIPYAHKELPIVPRQFGKVMDSKYGR